MTATMKQVRQALATRLSSITGLSTYAFPPGTANAPAALIAPNDGQFYTYNTSQTSHDLELVVAVLVQMGERQSATEELDLYLDDSGTHSVYAALAADPRLGNTVDSAVVVAAQNYGTHTYNGVDYQGVEFVVAVLL
jgi:hypothetical protein